MTEGVRTTCPYCGVGCGVIARPDGTVVGDPAHPANFGKLCSKGSALAETLIDGGRLQHPTVGGEAVTWDVAMGVVADRFRATIAEHGPDSVAFYVSGQCLTEDYYVANKLMKGFIGSANIDTNSRLCMASSVAGHVRGFGEDVVPGLYEDFEEADLVVLVGANLAWCHPVLHQRLLAARARRGTRIVVIDPRRTATCEDADLHLPLAPGSDVALFAGLLAHLDGAGAIDVGWSAAHTVGLVEALAAAHPANPADITGLDPADIATFYRWFAETPRVVTAFSQGVNQSSAGSDKVNAILNVHLATGRIGRPGMGPFSVTGQPNAMGGREVGGLANQLAAHMQFRPADIDRVRRFWDAPNLAAAPGLKAVDLFDAVADGRVRAIWIMATNPADSMPRAGQVRAALAACPFVVVSDSWPTDTTALAHVVLPAAGWGEKDGTVTNSERRISRQRPFRAPPGGARADWTMLADLGRRLGWAEHFAWTGPAAIWREHAALSAFENDGNRIFDLGALATIDDAGYDVMAPTLWPVGAEGGRLFADGQFPTDDGRARILPTVWRPIEALLDSDFPLLLNTGRVRDQWHTMTRTGLVPRLMAHTDEPRAAMHPTDLARLGMDASGLVRIASRHGAMTIRAVPDPGQRPGEVFVPMHWTDLFSSAGPAGSLTSPVCDPVSGQPELKATAIQVAPVPTLWRGVLLHVRPVRPWTGVHWSRLPLDQGHAFDLAGTDPLPPGPALATMVAALLDAPAGADRLELADAGRGIFRFATIVDGRLDACLFLADARRDAKLPRREALADLLGQPVDAATRPAVLAGGAMRRATEAAVCICFSVGLTTLRDAVISKGLTSVEEIGATLRAGTNCGSCVPELRRILRDASELVA